MAWNDEERTLSFSADLVGNDRYTVTVRVPDGYQLKSQNGFDSAEEENGVLKLTVTAPLNENRSFQVVF